MLFYADQTVIHFINLKLAHVGQSNISWNLHLFMMFERHLYIAFRTHMLFYFQWLHKNSLYHVRNSQKLKLKENKMNIKLICVSKSEKLLKIWHQWNIKSFKPSMIIMFIKVIFAHFINKHSSNIFCSFNGETVWKLLTLEYHYHLCYII